MSEAEEALRGRSLVFIGGLHRSGTSLLASELARHPDVSGFHDTGVAEDEGQHLQSTYPPASSFGGAGRFAFASGAHLVEVDNQQAARDRAALAASWLRYWDSARPVLVEKSPPNLIRMRYLQSVFPDARFVVLIRHPVPVALATKKWRRRRTLWSLMRHWTVAHDIASRDAAHINRLLTVRYEDLVTSPSATLAQVIAFVGADESRIPTTDRVSSSPSATYAARWRSLQTDTLTRAYTTALARRFGPEAARFGYGFDDIEAAGEWRGRLG